MNRLESARHVRIAVLLLLLSGTGSLTLEVVWSRLLKLVFGSTTLAISTVLVAYMLGLGIGGLLGGRWSHRFRGWRAYGWLEIGIALYAFTVPYTLSLYPALARTAIGDLDPAPAAMVRFLLSLLVLLLPTILMGATLPVLAAALLDSSAERGRGIGALYAANTFGAVAGTVLSTFVMFPWIGVRATNAFGASLDLLAGTLALWLARGERPAPAATVPPRAARGWDFGIWSYGVVGMTALICEVAWTRALGMVFGSSTYAFAAMLATFLTGLALGSLLIRSRVDRITRPMAAYAAGAAALGVTSLVTIGMLGWAGALFEKLYFWIGISGKTVVLASFVISAASMILPTLVLGALFPLLARALAERHGAGAAIGELYFVNTIGSALGAFLGGFLLIPRLGLFRTLALAVALNLLTAAAVLLWQRDWRPRLLRPAAFGAVAAAILTLLLPSAWSERAMTRGSYYQPHASLDFGIPELPLPGVGGEETVFYRDGVSATVSIDDGAGGAVMRINGKPDASIGDMSTQVLSGQIPMLWGAPAHSALVIGYASGVTSGSIGLFQPERLDVVEIEPAVIEASHVFDPVNGRPLEQPFTRLILDDGRTWLQRTARRYDVIVSEPSNPFLAGCANLFTREFFSYVHRALTPQGRLLQWIQLYGMDPSGLASVLAAVNAEFRHVYAFRFVEAHGDLLLYASDTPLTAFPAPRIESLALPIQRDLQRIGIDSSAQFWSLLRLTDAETRQIAAEAPRLNTDDSMYVELRAPWWLHTPTTTNQRAFAERIGVAALLADPALGISADELGAIALATTFERREGALARALLARAEAGGGGPSTATAASQLPPSGELDPLRSERLLDQAVSLDPAAPLPRLVRARQAMAAQQPDLVLRELGAASSAATDPRLIDLRLQALTALGRFVEAQPVARALLETGRPDHDPGARARAAIALAAGGDVAGGAAALEQLVRYLRYTPREWEVLAAMYTDLGRTDDAARARQCAAVARHNLAVLDHREALYAEMVGHPAEARAALEQLMRRYPDYVAAQHDLQRLAR